MHSSRLGVLLRTSPGPSLSFLMLDVCHVFPFFFPGPHPSPRLGETQPFYGACTDRLPQRVTGLCPILRCGFFFFPKGEGGASRAKDPRFCTSHWRDERPHP